MVKQIDEDEVAIYIEMAIADAKKSTCFRSKCGAVIIKNGNVLGKGFNSPPQGVVLDHCIKYEFPKGFKSDKTCCVHAEQRAIIDAIDRCGKNGINGGRLYFARLDLNGEMIPSGFPYCTICSKMALDVGIGEWCLLHDKKVYGKRGYYIYNAKEYHLLSQKYRGD